MFISKHYANKLWTNHERESAQARAFKKHGTYILPVRIDDTEIPGIKETIGYIDLRQSTIAQLTELTLEKLESDKISLKQKQQILDSTSNSLVERIKKKESEINFEKKRDNYLRSFDAGQDVEKDMGIIQRVLETVVKESSSFQAIEQKANLKGISRGDLDLIFKYDENATNRYPTINLGRRFKVSGNHVL